MSNFVSNYNEVLKVTHIAAMKLTDSIINSSKSKDKPYSLPDGQGLVLYVQPSGAKWWRYRYRYNGKAKMLSMGTYPRVSLKAAREAHASLRKLLSEGIDPSQHRQEQKNQQLTNNLNNFESVAKKWWGHWQAGVTDRHAGYAIRRLEAHILPNLGDRPITEIKSVMVIKEIQKVQDKNLKDLPKRLLIICNQIMRYAVSHDLIDHNPLASIQPRDILKPYEEKHFARVSIEDTPKLLRDIEGYSNPITRYALQVVAYTFVRTDELIAAKWLEFDLPNKVWTIPKQRTKKKTEHVVMLSNQVISILKKVKVFTGNGQYVFAGNRADKPMSNNTMLKALERLGYHKKMTVHGSRGIAATALREESQFKYEVRTRNKAGIEETAMVNKYTNEHIEIQLGHLFGTESQRAYDSARYLSDRARMLRDWANYLDTLKNGSDALSFRPN